MTELMLPDGDIVTLAPDSEKQPPWLTLPGDDPEKYWTADTKEIIKAHKDLCAELGGVRDWVVLFDNPSLVELYYLSAAHMSVAAIPQALAEAMAEALRPPLAEGVSLVSFRNGRWFIARKWLVSDGGAA